MISYEIKLSIENNSDESNDLMGLRYSNKEEALASFKMLDRFIPHYKHDLRITLASFEGNKLKEVLKDSIL